MDADARRRPIGAGTGIDLKALSQAAHESESQEAYLEISRGGDHRMGVVASIFPSDCVYYTLECAVHLFTEDGGVEPVRLERASDLVRALDARDYELSHLDDGWISCEKILPPEQVALEVRYLLHRVREPAAASARNASKEGVRSP